jgi:hypothetical protein
VARDQQNTVDIRSEGFPGRSDHGPAGTTRQGANINELARFHARAQTSNSRTSSPRHTFFERFQHASRKVREDLSFADGQIDEALLVHRQHCQHSAVARRSPTLIRFFLRFPFSTQSAFYSAPRHRLVIFMNFRCAGKTGKVV